MNVVRKYFGRRARELPMVIAETERWLRYPKILLGYPKKILGLVLEYPKNILGSNLGLIWDLAR